MRCRRCAIPSGCRAGRPPLCGGGPAARDSARGGAGRGQPRRGDGPPEGGRRGPVRCGAHARARARARAASVRAGSPACPAVRRALRLRPCGRGGTGRHTELKIRRPQAMRVRVPPPAPCDATGPTPVAGPDRRDAEGPAAGWTSAPGRRRTRRGPSAGLPAPSSARRPLDVARNRVRSGRPLSRPLTGGGDRLGLRGDLGRTARQGCEPGDARRRGQPAARAMRDRWRPMSPVTDRRARPGALTRDDLRSGDPAAGLMRRPDPDAG